MSHTHIGKDDWTCIARLLQAGHSLSEIARIIWKDKSSVSRHVKEFGGRDGYDAHEVRRRKRMKRIAAMESIRVIKGAMLRFIKKELVLHKSPEQISGILSKKRRAISPSTIYRYIDERAPHLKKYLRSQKGRYRRRRGTKKREQEREQELRINSACSRATRLGEGVGGASVKGADIAQRLARSPVPKRIFPFYADM
mgnify:CR=1 FL=1